MNTIQFTYWLKGYVSSIEETPSIKQWIEILTKLSKVDIKDSKQNSQTVFRDEDENFNTLFDSDSLIKKLELINEN